jgi:hypothetical protein
VAALNVTPLVSLPAFPLRTHLYLVPRRAIAADFIPCEYEVQGFGPCDAQLCGRRALASSVTLQIPVCQSHLAEADGAMNLATPIDAGVLMIRHEAWERRVPRG